MLLLTYGLEVGQEEQTRRLEARIHYDRKNWKLSPLDLKSYSRWCDDSRARGALFAATDREPAPWHVVDSNDRKRSRLHVIHHLLEQIACEPGQTAEVALPRRQKRGECQDPSVRPRSIPEPYGLSPRERS